MKNNISLNNNKIFEKDLLGSFIIILSHITSDPTSYFFFLDHKTNKRM
jgi:hypothetical protein